MIHSNTFMPDASPEERRRVLIDNCERKETTDFIKPLNEEELYAKREQLAEATIKLRDLSEEKQQVISDFKARETPLKKEQDRLLTEIKTGQIDTYGDLYLIANHEEGMMYFYDETGELIKTRRLKPEEKQGKLLPFDGRRAAANDQ